MKIFQMKVSGFMACFDNKSAIFSKKVYTKKPGKDKMEAFKKECCGDGLTDLDYNTTEVSVHELELEDD